MRLYHATYLPLLESILKKGLIPNYRDNWDGMSSEHTGVYLTDDKDVALSFAECAESTDDLNDLTEVVLRIDVPDDIALLPDPNMNDEESEVNYYLYPDNIPAAWIVGYEIHRFTIEGNEIHYNFPTPTTGIDFLAKNLIEGNDSICGLTVKELEQALLYQFRKIWGQDAVLNVLNTDANEYCIYKDDRIVGVLDIMNEPFYGRLFLPFKNNLGLLAESDSHFILSFLNKRTKALPCFFSFDMMGGGHVINPVSNKNVKFYNLFKKDVDVYFEDSFNNISFVLDGDLFVFDEHQETTKSRIVDNIKDAANIINYSF